MLLSLAAGRFSQNKDFYFIKTKPKNNKVDFRTTKHQFQLQPILKIPSKTRKIPIKDT